MNSSERKQNRRLRREAKRQIKKDILMKKRDNVDIVANPDNLIKAFRHASKSVFWKESVQKYDSKLLRNVLKLSDLIKSGKQVGAGFHFFKITERGKIRSISSVCIRERVAQRSLCSNILVPVLTKSLIYDNGASLKGKGISFAISRLKHHMVQHYKKYGSSGYVLRIDFKSYFANINHDAVKDIINKNFKDEELRAFITKFIDAFTEGGLGLGSEVSQIFAISLPNSIDHYIKEVLKIKCYGRYMDDLYLIHPSKEYLQYCYDQLKNKIEDLGIVINADKTQISPLKNGILFLKTRFFFTPTGKIIMKPIRSSIVRERRKLKKLKRFYKNGEMKLDEVCQSYISWRGFISHKNARRSVYNMDKLVRRLFGTNFYEKKKHAQTIQNTPAPTKRKYSPMELECIKYQMRLDAIMMEIHKHKPGSQEFIDLTNEKLSLEKRTRRLTDKIIKQKAHEIVQQNIDIINNERK